MTLVCEEFGFPLPPPWAPIGYTLATKRHRGTEVGLICAGHWWNLSYMLNHYPASFKDARAWIAVYAEQYGQEIREMIWSEDEHRYIFKPTVISA